jgi:hypothetical protein
VKLASERGLKPPPGTSGGSVADFVSFGGARATGNRQLATVAEAAFDSGLNHILLIAAVLAIAGAALCAVLVRPADFVVRREAAPAQPAGQPA